MTEQERIDRGNQAKAILNSDIFKEAAARLDHTYVEAWKAAKTVELREDAHRYVRVLEWFKADLQSIINTGALAEQRTAALRGDPVPLAEFRRG